VSNNLALKHIRAMRKGDLALIYHSGDEKAIVGIAEVVSDPYPDPKLQDDKRVVVDLKPKKRLSSPVPLAAVKAKKEFARFELVRMPRLSVMPVARELWHTLLAMAK
jgi:predicted RNA-binding protein with PUA-like domain